MRSLASIEQTATPMRDGVPLAADLYRPPSGRVPTLLLRTPYGRRDLPDMLREVAVEPLLAVRKGFAVMIQDLRGRWDSGGDFAPFVSDGIDCADTIAWIRKQPWSDGRVAMVGASYQGFVQFPAARARPEGLHAIAPTASGRFDLTVKPGGALRLWLLPAWADLLLADALAGELDAATRSEIEDLLEASPLERFAAFFESGSAMARFAGSLLRWNLPLSDSYWTETVGVPEKPLPAVHTTGYYDVCLAGAVEVYEAWNAVGDPAAPQMLTLGPWDHMRAAPYGDLGLLGARVVPQPIMAFGRQLAFLSAVLGMPGAEQAAPVMSFVLGRNRWHEGTSWPPQGMHAVEMPLALDATAEGRIALSATGEKRAVDYLYDPRDPVPTLGGAVSIFELAGPMEQARVESREDVLTFTSERFDAELELAGAPVASLLLSSSAPATDFIARLTLVQEDGRSLPLVDGIWSGRLADLPSQGQDASYRRCDIKLGPIHMVLMPGQRLRLQVTSSCYPDIYPNPNTGHDLSLGPPPSLQTAKQSLLVGAPDASSLRLPVLGEMPREASGS
jgi:putative CocE/NonD family hydrolase